MKQKKGFSLIEVLVASVILAMVVGGAAVTHVSIRQLSKEMVYRYTALNLAREVLEFGEAGTLAHEFRMKYYYPSPTGCTIPDTGCDNGSGCRRGIEYTEGYKLKEWWYFCDTNPDPFDYLGDIKARGLVPKGTPHSVIIYYKVEQDTNFYNAYKQTVEISWQEEPEGKIKKEILSVIPVRQVNDQLRLTTAEFWWE